MKQTILLFLILVTGFVFGQTDINVESEFVKYQNELDRYSQINPEINTLNEKRNKLNETLGTIILESDPGLRKKYILSNISKNNQNKYLNLSNSEIEKIRKDHDYNYKAKILYLCKNIDLEYLEFSMEESRKKQAKYLIDNGYDLNEFNKLSNDKKNEILKNIKTDN